MSAYLTRGNDTSGRPIRMSAVMADWWDAYTARLGFTPTITQGGHMGSLAAAASGPTHDGDALDLRVWDRTQSQVTAMVRLAREMGAAAWLRDRLHGGFSDPHVHLVPGRWAHPSPSALRQWDDLADRGLDGLASRGRDYHPYPLARTWTPEDDMADPKTQAQLDRIESDLADVKKMLATVDKRAKNSGERDRALRAQIAKVGGLTTRQTEQVLAAIRSADE